MSCEIVQSMQNKQYILVEAGVGIGKSFAYIVPLLYYHKRYKKPIIIATSTIALQEQLTTDIATIEDMLNYYPDIVIAKGQNHFLCRNRFEEFFFDKNKDSEEYVIYLEINKGGYEKSDWNIDISENVWKRINVREYNPIFWMNVKRKGKKGIIVSKCPKNVNKLTEELLFEDDDFKTILTSATLTSGNSENHEENYSYFIANTNYPVNSSIIWNPKYLPLIIKHKQ